MSTDCSEIHHPACFHCCERFGDHLYGSLIIPVVYPSPEFLDYCPIHAGSSLVIGDAEGMYTDPPKNATQR